MIKSLRSYDNLYLWILFILGCNFSVVIGCSRNDDCENAVCEFGHCSCLPGTFRTDCSGDASETLPKALIASQIFLSILFIPAFSFGLYGLYMALTHTRLQAVSPLANIRLHIFLSYQLTVIVNFLATCIDPFMSHGIIKSRFFLYLMTNFTYPFSIFGFGCILFHWIDVIHLATVTLNREWMLHKISKTYRGKDVTLEDILKQVKFMSNLKIPFLVAMGLVFVLTVLLSYSQAFSQYPRTSERAYSAVATISFMVLSAGFLHYGRKMVKLMPFELTKRVQKLTRRLQILCVAVVLVILTLMLLFFVVGRDRSAEATIAALLLVGCLKYCVGIIAICCLFERTNRFPFVVFSFSTESSKQSEKASGSTSDEVADLRQTSLELFYPEKQDPNQEQITDNDGSLVEVFTTSASISPLVADFSVESAQTTYSNPSKIANNIETSIHEELLPRPVFKSYSSDAQTPKQPSPSANSNRKFGKERSLSMHEQKSVQ